MTMSTATNDEQLVRSYKKSSLNKESSVASYKTFQSRESAGIFSHKQNQRSTYQQTLKRNIQLTEHRTNFIMCECHYMRIQCESPAFVKRETGCPGKVRDKMYEKICVHYCEIKKIIEHGRCGNKKWTTGVCDACKKHYKERGFGYDPTRTYSMATNAKKPKPRSSDGLSRLKRSDGGSLSGKYSRRH